MSHVTDKCACRVAWQLRIGIQGDDVPDRSKDGRITDNIREGSLLPTPQQGIELLQFATLALVSHPHPLNRIPHPGSVKQIEDTGTILPVGLVERLDSCVRVREQRPIIWQSALGRVMEIRQQGKEQIGITITQIANLQGFYEFINLAQAAQQGGDNHHGAVNGWNSLRKILAWQRARRQHQCDDQVNHRDGQCRDSDDASDRKKPVSPVTRPGHAK